MQELASSSELFHEVNDLIWPFKLNAPVDKDFSQKMITKPIKKGGLWGF